MDAVLLFLSDKASCINKSGRVMKTYYLKIINATRWEHGKRRVAEEVHGRFPTVDTYVSSVKQVFLKAPSRTILFKT